MIESFSDPDNLLYCPSVVVVLGIWAEHKIAGCHSMVVILSNPIRPLPFNLLLLPEASDGAL